MVKLAYKNKKFMNSKSLKFIDLFAGLGGFHLALKGLGHECIFASELDPTLSDLYEKNFGLKPHGDIKKILPSSIPKHDILCAGSPCQPFSKAGAQEGFDHPKWGDLFDYVLEIVKYHKPKYILLENVPNLKRHNEGKTFGHLESKLAAVGYNIKSDYFSPHEFGVPQYRKRVFIVGSLEPLDNFKWPERQNSPVFIKSILDELPKEARQLTPQALECLKVWQKFIELFSKKVELPSFPIWAMEFGATYPFEKASPFALSASELQSYHGSFGRKLKGLSKKQIMETIPAYARTEQRKFPKWKIDFIKQNRDFYNLHKRTIKPWLPLIQKFPPSLQKFEWNCKGEERNIWNNIIQFRASGVRVKRPTVAPTLVAMTTTQTPIVGWEKRYITPKECSRLQSMQALKYLPKPEAKAFKALGNAVNVAVVKAVASALLNHKNSSPNAGKAVQKQKVFQT